MIKRDLNDIAKKLAQKPRGILAMDESTSTITKRLEKRGIKSTEDNRRNYREMIVTTQGLGEFISGAILYDETFWQKCSDGKKMIDHLQEQNIMHGIKVDMGAKDNPDFPGGKITEGLDGLPKRLKRYREQGAYFAKWRAVITVEQSEENTKAIRENAKRLSKYAQNCIDANIVPILEPEVIRDGSHSIEDDYKKTHETLMILFDTLREEGVDLTKIILKPNMVTPGKSSDKKPSKTPVPEKTIHVLKECVPKEVPAIVFLSGGLNDEDATNFLREINKNATDVPWKITFSYARALQNSSMDEFAKEYPNEDNFKKAQEILLNRAKACSEAIKE